jgi:HAD superfamily hydrolase (TIGR01458 family)
MTIRGILLDLEGVLYQDGKAIQGAVAAVERLRADGLRLRFLTNTTTQPRRVIVERLDAMGFRVAAPQVFSPPVAARAWLRQAGVRKIHLAAPPPLAEEFDEFELVDRAPDAVILGDLHKDFTWDRLNGLFRFLMDGARLVALHRNRYCRRDGEIGLDVGPFAAALEYAAGRPAEVVGKPHKAFFDLALKDLAVPAHQALMVGDDLEADIGGAKAAGLRAVQPRTGKYRPEDDDQAAIRPDARIATIADLPDLLPDLE